ncbi:low molecular weight phosphatase family protein [Allobranchiibius sp. GilTou38]|uniref:arsenate reductase/protein-tyrosine-phosphatase family protein n=1 Tax=Allobranchiibius sp. GilTou38 TaxID=2815210 RepID=UPI001AA1BB91|nr:low molecular weight phosphatase family protein [Allobranchiibius sp. GilTou38]MBO1767492.1 low molecular weight phosphatase family protein [Allobranchiibius sp. GilTou38]
MTDVGAVLVVCTGNVCRSPYIERLLRASIGDLGVQVSSAGTMALVGEPMSEESAELLTQGGVDAEGFVARQLTPAMVEQADLVLTATREHRSEVVRTAPRGLRYVFALADFSDLVGAADVPSGVSGVAGLVALASSRRGEVEARDVDDSGIDDPFRQGHEAYARMASQVEQVLPPIVAAFRQLSPTY